jgi:hypothetical protein
MFPLDPQDIDQIAPERWLRIVSLIAIALHILGLVEIPLPRGLASKALFVLKPAEARARRLVLPYGTGHHVHHIPSQSRGPRPSAPRCENPGQHQCRRVPRSRLTEPLGPAPQSNGIRIRFFNEPRRRPPAPSLPCFP